MPEAFARSRLRLEEKEEEEKAEKLEEEDELEPNYYLLFPNGEKRKMWNVISVRTNWFAFWSILYVASYTCTHV